MIQVPDQQEGRLVVQYNGKLASINLLVKARSFLVLQGGVESIASRTPAELTKLFENISDSDELIAEYDDLKRAKTQAEEDLKFAQQK